MFENITSFVNLEGYHRFNSHFLGESFMQRAAYPRAAEGRKLFKLFETLAGRNFFETAYFNPDEYDFGPLSDRLLKGPGYFAIETTLKSCPGIQISLRTNLNSNFGQAYRIKVEEPSVVGYPIGSERAMDQVLSTLSKTKLLSDTAVRWGGGRGMDTSKIKDLIYCIYALSRASKIEGNNVELDGDKLQDLIGKFQQKQARMKAKRISAQPNSKAPTSDV